VRWRRTINNQGRSADSRLRATHGHLRGARLKTDRNSIWTVNVPVKKQKCGNRFTDA